MLDEFFNKLSESLANINKKLEDLSKYQENQIEILSTTDIMQILKINRNQANALFHSKDFPKIQGIKSNKIERTAFVGWLRRNNFSNGIDYSKM